uniref:Uncharacterized protein n=1 Tax=Arundo donax TaxID=35708 RepID=A0A0A8Z7V2_ARUDO
MIIFGRISMSCLLDSSFTLSNLVLFLTTWRSSLS